MVEVTRKIPNRDEATLRPVDHGGEPSAAVAVGTQVTPRHRVAGGGRPTPAPTERSVQIFRTTLFGRWFTAE